MPLTPQQLATLKADILADPALAGQPNNSDGHFAIRAAYLQVVSPTFYVWRSAVTTAKIMQNGFDWTRVDNLTVGKARIWEWMVQTTTLNPSQANVRAGILAVFGTAGDLGMRNAIFGHCQRAANRGEKLFASGAGTSTTDQGVGPATMAVEGAFTLDDIEAARNLP